MNAWRLSLRLLRREWRAGELRVLLLAVMVAVAGLTTVGFFTDRVRQALDRQAGQLLGADLVIASDHPLPPGYREAAAKFGLRLARTVSFPSMALYGERTRLAEVKAVSPGYPLRGRLQVSDGPAAPERDAAGIPQPGTVWLERRLLDQLALKVGDQLVLGNARLTVAAVLTREPDRSGNFFSIAPRLMMNWDDLARTGLIQPASRVHYRLLLAGPARAGAAFRTWAQPRLGRGERLEGVEDARPEVRAALDRGQVYLGLAALVSAVLAGVAVALGARRFMQRHLDSCALMRCFGASQGLIFRLYLYQFLWLGLAASLLGSILGYLAQNVLAYWLAPLFAAGLPQPALSGLPRGVLAGMALLLSFSLPPLLRLSSVPTLRVLRRELGPPRRLGGASYVLGFAVVGGLLLWQAGDIRLGAYALAGLGGTMFLAAAAAWGLIRLLAYFRGGGAWFYGLANVSRRKWGSVVQIVGFALGVMALLLLTLVRGDLMEGWRNTLPPDAPNRFVINVQPDQLAPLRRFFSLQRRPVPAFFPMVRGRLVAVNGRPVVAAGYADERARRLVEREFNLSWASRPRRDNQIVAGRWWGDSDRGRPLLSVEQGVARTLGIRLGDRLTYDVAGTRFTAKVANLRKVDWDSFQVNFFVVAAPGLLEGYPASYVTSFYLPPGKDALLNQMVEAFPNLTVIDVAAIMSQVRAVMDRVAGAMEFVFLFTLLAGLGVLYAAIVATRDERLYEAALLRTLGASRRQLFAGQLSEFAVIGLLAGLVAAAGASGAGYLLSTRVLNLPYVFNPWLWGVGVPAAGIGVTLAGLLGTRKILVRPPLETLRA